MVQLFSYFFPLPFSLAELRDSRSCGPLLMGLLVTYIYNAPSFVFFRGVETTAIYGIHVNLDLVISSEVWSAMPSTLAM